MNRVIGMLSLLLAALPALGAGQQERMKQCNADAANQQLKGEARKAFMKDCLSAKHGGPQAASAPGAGKPMIPQQVKMKKCNAEAKARSIAADSRKKFMSECLKSS
jgi:hypothetical protein